MHLLDKQEKMTEEKIEFTVFNIFWKKSDN